jgi:NitT/TauT family transport system substrate-binding protein
MLKTAYQRRFNRLKSFRVCAAFFILSFLSLGITAKAATEPETITFCRANNMVSALVYIAEAQGYLREEGLDVTFLTATNGKICQDDLIAGKADMASYAEGPMTYLSFSPHALQIVAQMEENPETSVFARRDHGINQESDIKGKTVGYLPGTVSYLYLARLVEKLGLSMEDMHLVALQPPTMPQALQGGVIDAFIMWEPWGHQAMQALGDKAIHLRDPKLYNYRALLITTKSFGAEHPARVEHLLRALLKAENYIHVHRSESIAFLSQTTSLDASVLEENWPVTEHKLKLDSSLISLMQDNARYISRDDPNFKDKPIPDFRTFIEPKFLREVAPERVEKGM